MDDLFSFDVNFQRICLMTFLGFFIISVFCFVVWSVYFYLPKQQRIKEAQNLNTFAKEFYTRKGLPVPENVSNPGKF